MRKNSVKNTRINEEVMRELSNIIRLEVKDPRISPVTSVVSVEVAPDLKTCKAYISVLGDDEAVKKTLEGLKSSASIFPPLIACLSASSVGITKTVPKPSNTEAIGNIIPSNLPFLTILSISSKVFASEM